MHVVGGSLRVTGMCNCKFNMVGMEIVLHHAPYVPDMDGVNVISIHHAVARTGYEFNFISDGVHVAQKLPSTVSK